MHKYSSITILSLLVATSYASAQTAKLPMTAASSGEQVVDLNSDEFKKLVEKAKENLPLLVTLETVGNSINPEERKKIELLAKQITDKSLQSLSTQEAKDYAPIAIAAKRRADDIADEALADKRGKVLTFLGIDPKSNNNLYYFLSFSMPIPMLQAYVLEAMWSGGTVVLKGAPPGRNIQDFLLKDIEKLIYGKGAAANVSIDPRLFEVYAVNTVPTIIYTEERQQLECVGPQASPVLIENEEAGYATCALLNPNLFWKVSGAITASYALKSFIEQGATGAQVYYSALRSGLATGAKTPKDQKGFSGEWKAALPPEVYEEYDKAVEAERLKQRAPSN
jgi:type-F conjugative transfer system pilin assembly protein TrbC